MEADQSISDDSNVEQLRLLQPGNHVRWYNDGKVTGAKLVRYVDASNVLLCTLDDTDVIVPVGNIKSGWQVVPGRFDSHLDAAAAIINGSNSVSTGDVNRSSVAVASSSIGLPQPCGGMFAKTTEGQIVLVGCCASQLMLHASKEPIQYRAVIYCYPHQCLQSQCSAFEAFS
jgi:hypothetical protein